MRWLTRADVLSTFSGNSRGDIQLHVCFTRVEYMNSLFGSRIQDAGLHCRILHFGLGAPGLSCPKPCMRGRLVKFVSQLLSILTLWII